MLLDQGFNLTLRPMKYPDFYEKYKDGIRNTWTVDEITWAEDLVQLADPAQVTEAERHLIHRLVAFFATGDSIVANNLVLNLYRWLNAPEARMYLSRQLYEEALHVQFYLTLLDTYIPDHKEREAAFKAIETIPSIKQKADFMAKYMDVEATDRQSILQNVICFAACVEGLFFFGAFAYVYYFRSKGLFDGLASGTNWVFRDESCHMDFAFAVVETIRKEQPELFTPEFEEKIWAMLGEAIECELQFAQDVLAKGVTGLSTKLMREYLESVADAHAGTLKLPEHLRFGSKNPFGFMQLQDMQDVTNFFERRVSAYQVGLPGEFSLDEAF